MLKNVVTVWMSMKTVTVWQTTMTTMELLAETLTYFVDNDGDAYPTSIGRVNFNCDEISLVHHHLCIITH